MTSFGRVPNPVWPAGLSPRDTDHLVVVLSDVEMGAGGKADDFPQTPWLAELLLAYNREPFANVPVTVVFNGDTFDLLKMKYQGAWPTHVDDAVATGKLRRVMEAHPTFFSGVREFLAHTGAERRVAFIAGNHDPELLMPSVQEAIRRECSPPAPEALTFPGLSLRIGDVHIEHGSQGDPLFAMEADAPFVAHEGRRLLNLPWGSVALLEAAMPLTPILYHHDRLKPREDLLELLPGLRELLLSSFWQYWTRDYWQKFFAQDDPLRRVSWTMLREIVYRFRSRTMDVSISRPYEALLKETSDVFLCIVGHQHEAAWWSYAHKRLLRTGCLRNEFALLDEGRHQQPLTKVYAEVFMKGNRAVRSRLVEVEPPALPANYVPESIFEVRPRIEEALAARRVDETSRLARRKQEAAEARQEGPKLWPPTVPFPLRGSLRRSLEKNEGRNNGG